MHRLLLQPHKPWYNTLGAVKSYRLCILISCREDNFIPSANERHASDASAQVDGVRSLFYKQIKDRERFNRVIIKCVHGVHLVTVVNTIRISMTSVSSVK